MNIASGYPNLALVSVEEGNTAFYADENGVLYSYDKTKLFLFPNASGLTEYNIPDSVTTIVSGAFCGNKTIEEITGCKGLKTLDTNSFYICTALRSIYLPDCLTSVGNQAFFKCSSLESITIPDNVTTLGTYAFKGCSALKQASIGNGITQIPLEAFMDCTSLESVSLGNNINTIGKSAFKNCSKLADITIPAGVTVIKDYTFQNCESLRSIVVPDGVTAIYTSAFSGCSSLESVTLPASLNQINMAVFSDCTAIKNVYYTGNSAGWCSIKFSNSTSNPLYYAENLYIGGKLVTEIDIPDGVTAVSNFLFTNYDKLTSVTLPDSVTSIGSYAFHYCIGLESIVIPDSVTHIHDRSFAYCSNLTDISVSDNLEYIGTYAFFKSGYYNDYANWDNGFLYLETCLLDVDDDTVAAECRLYSKTTLIAAQAFYHCATITSFEMSDNVEYINTQAFYNCPNLRSVYLSSKLRKISDSSFAYCSALESINVPLSVSAIEDKAFWKCESLTEIDIPDNVVSIGSHAFTGCNKLEKIRLSESLEEIGSYAFSETTSLTEIYLPETLSTLNSTTFNSSGITDIYYGSNKANWKRVASGATFSGITIHYTLKSDDESVIINHTDNNFDWEAGNVHLVVTDLGNATSSYEQNGFYNRLMVDPIQVLDIKLVDGDGNDIQPLSDEKITVRIKASEEFMNLLKSGLSQVGEYEVEPKNIGFIDDCFVFESNGKKVSVAATETFLKKFKVIHWYSDAVEPTDHESFTHDEITVENGYIIIETDHFSEYAVCTDAVTPKDYTVKWIIDGVVTEQTVTEKTVIAQPENPEKEGYTFAGWTPSVPDMMPAENLEFNAVWQINQYTITFDTAGGNTISPITLDYGSAITPPENPTFEGYVFKSWTPEIPETMPAKDITVVANYEKSEVTVTGIKIASPPDKTKYTYKLDTLDLSGLVIRVIYSDGSSELVSETDMFKTSGFSADTTGKKTITVEYSGHKANFDVTVSYAWWQWLIRIFLLGFIWY